MTTISFKGKPLATVGELPAIGTIAPDFTLTKIDLSKLRLQELLGQKVILNIFPSLDTPTCATSVRKFNQQATELPNVKVLCVSADLPFAQKRFCGSEGLQQVIPLSTFQNAEFGENYGVTIAEGPLAGLLSRAVLVLDETGKVIYRQQVAELSEEPDYADALKILHN